MADGGHWSSSLTEEQQVELAEQTGEMIVFNLVDGASDAVFVPMPIMFSP
jgi:hypothetical protein